MSTTDIPEIVQDMFTDERVIEVRSYDDGFVPNAYRWPAPGEGRRWTRQEDGTLHEAEMSYDRKRSYGRATKFVALSGRGGRLRSA